MGDPKKLVTDLLTAGGFDYDDDKVNSLLKNYGSDYTKMAQDLLTAGSFEYDDDKVNQLLGQYKLNTRNTQKTVDAFGTEQTIDWGNNTVETTYNPEKVKAKAKEIASSKNKTSTEVMPGVTQTIDWENNEYNTEVVDEERRDTYLENKRAADEQKASQRATYQGGVGFPGGYNYIPQTDQDLDIATSRADRAMADYEKAVEDSQSNWWDDIKVSASDVGLANLGLIQLGRYLPFKNPLAGERQKQEVEREKKIQAAEEIKAKTIENLTEDDLKPLSFEDIYQYQATQSTNVEDATNKTLFQLKKNSDRLGVVEDYFYKKLSEEEQALALRLKQGDTSVQVDQLSPEFGKWYGSYDNLSKQKGLIKDNVDKYTGVLQFIGNQIGEFKNQNLDDDTIENNLIKSLNELKREKPEWTYEIEDAKQLVSGWDAAIVEGGWWSMLGSLGINTANKVRNSINSVGKGLKSGFFYENAISNLTKGEVDDTLKEEFGRDMRDLLAAPSSQFTAGFSSNVVEKGGLKLIVDEDGQVIDVRNKDNKKIFYPTEEQVKIIESYNPEYDGKGKQTYSGASIAYTTLQVASDMIPMIAASAVSGGSALGVAIGAGSTMYGSYYNEALQKTGDMSRASVYALVATGLTSYVESKIGKLEQKIGRTLSGTEKAAIRRSALEASEAVSERGIRSYVEGRGALTWLKDKTARLPELGNDIKGELLEEYSNFGVDAVSAAVADIPSESVRGEELEETFLITSLISGTLGGLRILASNAQEINEMLGYAAMKKDKFEQIGENWVNSATTDKEKELRRKDFEAKRTAVAEVSDMNAYLNEQDFSDEKKDELFNLALDKAKKLYQAGASNSQKSKDKYLADAATIEKEINRVAEDLGGKPFYVPEKPAGAEAEEGAEAEVVEPSKRGFVTQDEFNSLKESGAVPADVTFEQFSELPLERQQEFRTAKLDNTKRRAEQVQALLDDDTAEREASGEGNLSSKGRQKLEEELTTLQNQIKQEEDAIQKQGAAAVSVQPEPEVGAGVGGQVQPEPEVTTGKGQEVEAEGQVQLTKEEIDAEIAKIEANRKEELASYGESLNEAYEVGSEQTVEEYVNAKYNAQIAALEQAPQATKAAEPTPTPTTTEKAAPEAAEAPQKANTVQGVELTKKDGTKAAPAEYRKNPNTGKWGRVNAKGGVTPVSSASQIKELEDALASQTKAAAETKKTEPTPAKIPNALKDVESTTKALEEAVENTEISFIKEEDGRIRMTGGLIEPKFEARKSDKIQDVKTPSFLSFLPKTLTLFHLARSKKDKNNIIKKGFDINQTSIDSPIKGAYFSSEDWAKNDRFGRTKENLIYVDIDNDGLLYFDSAKSFSDYLKENNLPYRGATLSNEQIQTLKDKGVKGILLREDFASQSNNELIVIDKSIIKNISESPKDITKLPSSFSDTESIAEAYHKAKKDGSNPELVKAVEDLLGIAPSPAAAETKKTEPTPAKVAEIKVSDVKVNKAESYDSDGTWDVTYNGEVIAQMYYDKATKTWRDPARVSAGAFEDIWSTSDKKNAIDEIVSEYNKKQKEQAKGEGVEKTEQKVETKPETATTKPTPEPEVAEPAAAKAEEPAPKKGGAAEQLRQAFSVFAPATEEAETTAKPEPTKAEEDKKKAAEQKAAEEKAAAKPKAREGANGIKEIIFSIPGVKSEGFTIFGKFYNVVTNSKRAKVLVNINGTTVPFYLTTGLGGKKTGPGWFPYFGFGQDGWYNKTEDQDIIEFYEKYWGKEVADTVRAVSQELNRFYGTDPNKFTNDLNENSKFGKKEAEIEFENEVQNAVNGRLPFTPIILEDPNGWAKLTNNITTLGKAISKSLSDLRQGKIAQERVLPEQPTVAAEVAKGAVVLPNVSEGQTAADALSNFLNEAGISVEVVDSKTFKDIAQKKNFSGNADGVFLVEAGTGKIFLNKDKIEGEWGKTIVFHEGIHPVINIIRNTNPKLYNAIVQGIRVEAKKNKAVADAIAEVESSEDYQSKGEDVIEDETVVEVLARVASGKIKLSEVRPTLKERIVNMLNKVAEVLNLPKIATTSTDAQFKSFAAKLSKSLAEGGKLSEIVGQQAITAFETEIGKDQYSLDFRITTEGKVIQSSEKLPGKVSESREEKTFNKVDALLKAYPNALTNRTQWKELMSRVFPINTEDGVRIPAFPEGLYKMAKSVDGVLKELEKVSPEQRRLASEGLKATKEIGKLYEDGKMDEVDTGLYFLWNIMSIGISPYPQEAGFLRAVDGGIDTFIKSAADGTYLTGEYKEILDWDEKSQKMKKQKIDLGIIKFYEWVDTVLEKGKPGSGSKANLRAFGRSFLGKASTKIKSGEFKGMTRMQALHAILSDRKTPTNQLRRKWQATLSGMSFNNKIFDFILLTTGRSDLFVIDRVRTEHFWDADKLKKKAGISPSVSIYDGSDLVYKTSKAAGLSKLLSDLPGLVFAELANKTMQPIVKKAYTKLGVTESPDVGRFHWETWVASSSQEVSHGSIDAIVQRKQTGEIQDAGIRQGKYGSWDFNFVYKKRAGNPFMFEFTDDQGNVYMFDDITDIQKEILDQNSKKTHGTKDNSRFILKNENGEIIKRKTEKIDSAWYHQPGVDAQKYFEFLASKAKEIIPTPSVIEDQGVVIDNNTNVQASAGIQRGALQNVESTTKALEDIAAKKPITNLDFEINSSIEDNLSDKYKGEKNVVYHGSPDISYLSSVESLNPKDNTQNAESKYVYVNPNSKVARNYSTYYNGYGDKSGVAAFKIRGKKYVMKKSDILSIKNNEQNEAFLDRKREEGYDYVEIPQDGGNIAILNKGALELIGVENNSKSISEAYHKAKKDGTNPELVKSVEDLLAPGTAQASAGIKRELTPEQKQRRKELSDNLKNAAKAFFIGDKNLGIYFDPKRQGELKADQFKAMIDALSAWILEQIDERGRYTRTQFMNDMYKGKVSGVSLIIDEEGADYLFNKLGILTGRFNRTVQRITATDSIPDDVKEAVRSGANPKEVVSDEMLTHLSEEILSEADQISDEAEAAEAYQEIFYDLVSSLKEKFSAIDGENFKPVFLYEIRAMKMLAQRLIDLGETQKSSAVLNAIANIASVNGHILRQVGLNNPDAVFIETFGKNKNRQREQILNGQVQGGDATLGKTNREAIDEISEGISNSVKEDTEQIDKLKSELEDAAAKIEKLQAEKKKLQEEAAARRDVETTTFIKESIKKGEEYKKKALDAFKKLGFMSGVNPEFLKAGMDYTMYLYYNWRGNMAKVKRDFFKTKQLKPLQSEWNNIVDSLSEEMKNADRLMAKERIAAAVQAELDKTKQAPKDAAKMTPEQLLAKSLLTKVGSMNKTAKAAKKPGKSLDKRLEDNELDIKLLNEVRQDIEAELLVVPPAKRAEMLAKIDDYLIALDNRSVKLRTAKWVKAADIRDSIRKEAKSLGKTISELIDDHFDVNQRTQSLAEEFILRTGMSVDEAKPYIAEIEKQVQKYVDQVLAQKVQREYMKALGYDLEAIDAEIAKANKELKDLKDAGIKTTQDDLKQRQLEKKIKALKNKKEASVKRLAKMVESPSFNNVINALKANGLNEETVVNAFANSLGIDKIDQKTLDHFNTLVRKLQQAVFAADKEEAAKELKKFVYRIQNKSVLETILQVIESYAYGNQLSGPPTANTALVTGLRQIAKDLIITFTHALSKDFKALLVNKNRDFTNIRLFADSINAMLFDLNTFNTSTAIDVLLGKEGISLQQLEISGQRLQASISMIEKMQAEIAAIKGSDANAVAKRMKIIAAGALIMQQRLARVLVVSDYVTRSLALPFAAHRSLVSTALDNLPVDNGMPLYKDIHKKVEEMMRKAEVEEAVEERELIVGKGKLNKNKYRKRIKLDFLPEHTQNIARTYADSIAATGDPTGYAGVGFKWISGAFSPNVLTGGRDISPFDSRSQKAATFGARLGMMLLKFMTIQFPRILALGAQGVKNTTPLGLIQFKLRQRPDGSYERVGVQLFKDYRYYNEEGKITEILKADPFQVAIRRSMAVIPTLLLTSLAMQMFEMSADDEEEWGYKVELDPDSPLMITTAYDSTIENIYRAQGIAYYPHSLYMKDENGKWYRPPIIGNYKDDFWGWIFRAMGTVQEKLLYGIEQKGSEGGKYDRVTAGDALSMMFIGTSNFMGEYGLGSAIEQFSGLLGLFTEKGGGLPGVKTQTQRTVEGIPSTTASLMFPAKGFATWAQTVKGMALDENRRKGITALNKGIANTLGPADLIDRYDFDPLGIGIPFQPNAYTTMASVERGIASMFNERYGILEDSVFEERATDAHKLWVKYPDIASNIYKGSPKTIKSNEITIVEQQSKPEDSYDIMFNSANLKREAMLYHYDELNEMDKATLESKLASINTRANDYAYIERLITILEASPEMANSDLDLETLRDEITKKAKDGIGVFEDEKGDLNSYYSRKTFVDILVANGIKIKSDGRVLVNMDYEKMYKSKGLVMPSGEGGTEDDDETMMFDQWQQYEPID